jgi:hypothetical protein
MNIRCAFCQTPYTLSRNEILFALQKIDNEKLNHYDAHCPRCRRATQLPTQRLEMALPNWRQAAEEQAAMPPAPILEPKPAKPQPVKLAETAVTETIVKEKPTTSNIQLVKPAEKVVKKPAVKTKAAPAKATASKTKPAASKKTTSKPIAGKGKTTKKK